VIVSENVGVPINDGREGFVVPVRDPEAIVQKLVYLYENEAEREAMGKRAGDYAQVFDWPNYQRQLVALYRRLAGLPEA
jgi:glycosyltransferase involved in cell wall biosynthesis